MEVKKQHVFSDHKPGPRLVSVTLGHLRASCVNQGTSCLLPLGAIWCSHHRGAKLLYRVAKAVPAQWSQLAPALESSQMG